jgi:hypothetical protein
MPLALFTLITSALGAHFLDCYHPPSGGPILQQASHEALPFAQQRLGACWPSQLKETNMDEDSRTQLEAAAFRGLVAHLQQRTDVQNIDLMNLAGFCRNCLSKWYMAAAQDQGVPVDYDAARELVYGMAYDEWKRDYQGKATEQQKTDFETTKPLHASISGHHKA